MCDCNMLQRQQAVYLRFGLQHLRCYCCRPGAAELDGAAAARTRKETASGVSGPRGSEFLQQLLPASSPP